MATAGPEPGWYVDPEGAEGQQRYWNGSEWTEHRKATGLPSPEPVPVRVVMPKRGPIPSRVKKIATACVVLAGLIWFGLEMKAAHDRSQEFDDLQRQREQNLENFRDDLSDACSRNPSQCRAG
ncbi:DUF2510 domain-containing protein [Mycolicibacterium bacteremicum]|uniref:DUF2510 domain-containing protein n=1 Tax=Mycolicibacterium bacteremicum TaxID=564198 RepID=UPI0026EA9F3D|nr:DUF2510 domain-containing protein [Mycolicibacterium bacteremicum]